MTLAHWSNLFVYASIATFLFAFVAFAVSFAATRTVPPHSETEEREAALVGAGAREAGASGSAAAAADTSAPGTLASGLIGPAEPAGALPDPALTSAEAAAQARSAARARSPQIEAELVAEAGRGGSDPLPPGRRAGNIAMSLTWLSFLLLAAGVVARGLWADRVPWGNMYEFSITSALAVSGVFLLVSLRRDVRWLGLFVTAACLMTLGIAVLVLYNDSPQLVPALHSYWLIIHVSAAIIASGAFTVGAGATFLYLAADRAEREAPAGGPKPVSGALAGPRARVRATNSRLAASIAARVPDSQTLDQLAYRVNAFVFPLWTFAVVAGAIWAEDAWGRYWGWDPKETWAFITWVVYAGYLHARATAGWRGRRAAVIAIIGFACFLFNFFGINLLASGLHSYAGVS